MARCSHLGPPNQRPDHDLDARRCGGKRALKQWVPQDPFPQRHDTLHLFSLTAANWCNEFSVRDFTAPPIAAVSDLWTRMHDDHVCYEKVDLEGGRPIAAPQDTGFLHSCYPYLFERGPRASWKLFAGCALMVSQRIVRHCRK